MNILAHLNTADSSDKYVIVRAVPVGDSSLNQIYTASTLSENQHTLALRALLAELKTGLDKLRPALFLVYYQPDFGIQLLRGVPLKNLTPPDG